MKFWSSDRTASISIGILLLVLVRSLGEYFRLKHVYGQRLMIAKVEPFIIGSLATSVGVGLAFGLYITHKYKTAIVVCAATIAALLIYKILVIT